MAAARRTRGPRVVYKEVGSDDSDYEYDDFTKVVLVDNLGDDDDSNDIDFCPNNSAMVTEVVPKVRTRGNIRELTTRSQVVFPELSPVQKELKKVCRLGDKNLLQSFLRDHPDIELDVKDVDGGTLLTEAATKTAQFSDIVEVLVETGAGLGVCDSLGNSPLHNAVLYYPSTQRSVDLLLQCGASVTIKNNEGVLPEGLAEDKDLKAVLKELRKAAGRKKSVNLSVNHYLNSPELRRKVFDKRLMEETLSKSIVIKYNQPIVINSPGLLKRKRKSDNLDDSDCGREKKRIRWCQQENNDSEEDPQFSSEEDEGSISQDVDDCSVPDGIDSEEDVIIVHKDVKKPHSLNSDTEVCLKQLETSHYIDGNLLTVSDTKEEKNQLKSEDVVEELNKVVNVESEDSSDCSNQQLSPTVPVGLENDEDNSATEGRVFQDQDQGEEENTGSVSSMSDIHQEGVSSQATTEKDADIFEPKEDTGEEDCPKAPTSQQCDIDDKVQNKEGSSEVIEEPESEIEEKNQENSSEQSQVIIKCSQGFGFFVGS